ncbi:MAG: response regulator [Candidatus Levybacteria bacterium]|nr:response regulator [Candidatus Levybacteria bacterium]
MIKVLIVEDDVLISRMYQKVFESEGYEVLMAGNGQEGLDMARTKAPTIILLDIMMPKMNGMQMLEQIKADPKIAKIPVIVLTNLSGTTDAERALKLGAVKYIVKSEHKPKDVFDMVKGILAASTRDEIPEA